MKLTRELLDQLEVLTRPLANRVANSIARAVISLVDDTKQMQSLQIAVLADEALDDAERLQQYGFTSVPLTGAEVVAVFPNGDHGHALVIATDDRRHRPTDGDAGDVTIYNSAGAQVRLRGADIELVPGPGGEIRAGSATSSDPVALKSELDTLKSAITDATPLANDGGSQLKTQILAALGGWPTGATKLKTE